MDIPPETRVGDFTSKPSELNLARWSDRIAAWLIDFIMVTIGIEILFYAATFPLWFDNNPDRWFRGGASGYLVRSLIFLAYWTYFESTNGQSIGKRILRLKTVCISGQTVNVRDALVESFGKSFLLPIDLILGWIFTNDKRQRIFNKASNTIVIKLKSYTKENSFMRYTKD
ncbi:MAG: RDD family protein [Candidatus Nitrosopolaris sp.]